MRPKSLASLLTCLLAVACARAPATAGGPSAGQAGLQWPEVVRLQRARDYFALRDRLAVGPATTPPARYARALVQHAFNAPAVSNATIAALLADERLPDSLATGLRRVQAANHLRLFAYAAGLAVTSTLLADTARFDAATLRDLRNDRRIFSALATVPPQTVAIGGPSTLRFEQGLVPVRVNDSLRRYGFDTGANLSTMMRSEARALGLRVLPAGIEVGSATDRRVTADLAVADRLTLGRAEYHHVVFLVLDDSLLTFPDGFQIRGLVGFPVIEQLGEVQVARDGEIVVPAPAPARAARNLAFEGLTPLTRVGWGGTGQGADGPGGVAGAAALLCRLDTGANRTQFYAPFYRRFRAGLDATTTATARVSGGVGGYRELPTRVLRPARLALGDTTVVLDSADVLTRPIVRDAADDYLDCNVGRDALYALPRYILNFRDMAFLLR
jgi:hypothetical protein